MAFVLFLIQIFICIIFILIFFHRYIFGYLFVSFSWYEYIRPDIRLYLNQYKCHTLDCLPISILYYLFQSLMQHYHIRRHTVQWIYHFRGATHASAAHQYVIRLKTIFFSSNKTRMYCSSTQWQGLGAGLATQYVGRTPFPFTF